MLEQIIVLVLCIGLIQGKTLPEEEDDRSGRLFGYRYTITVTQQEEVTSLIPSSCVHVEASLPPCRNVRNLDSFPKFIGSQRYNGRQLAVAQQPPAPPAAVIHTTPLGWGEYFGLYAPTVTISTIKQHVTTILDPRVVVTFSVKGCKPSRLPLDLMECPGTGQNALGIQPTVPVPQLVTTTVRPMDTNSLTEANSGTIQPPNNIQASEANVNPNIAVNNAPTAPLK